MFSNSTTAEVPAAPIVTMQIGRAYVYLNWTDAPFETPRKRSTYAVHNYTVQLINGTELTTVYPCSFFSLIIILSQIKDILEVRIVSLSEI